MPSVISRPLGKTAPARRPRALRKGLPRRERAPGFAVPRCTVDARTPTTRGGTDSCAVDGRPSGAAADGACSSAAKTVLCPPSLRGRYCHADGITCSRPIPHQIAVWPRQVAVTAVPYASLTGIFHVESCLCHSDPNKVLADLQNVC